jgi:anti-anti-sigma regulatory factor
MPESGVEPVSIDVGHLVRRNLASLYSSLVTRPTGQAVRMAIENVLAEEKCSVCVSVIDLSEVSVMDFSCADEVVAKLLLRFLRDDRPRNVFFVFRGIRELHRDPMEVVLTRQSLAAVCETGSGGVRAHRRSVRGGGRALGEPWKAGVGSIRRRWTS